MRELTRASLEREDSSSNLWFRPLSRWPIYRKRYFVSYFLIGLVSVLVAAISINTVPAGINEVEAASIVNATNLDWHNILANTVNLPYYLLQKLSLGLFGVTPLGVRMPSIILSFASMVFLMLTTRRWFSTNIALITNLVIVSSSWMLSLSRVGTPDISIVFFTSLIVMLATYISQQAKGQEVFTMLLLPVTALAVYTPPLIYLPVTALIAIWLQPHLRYVIRSENKLTMALGMFLAILILIPISWSILGNPNRILEILAIPGQLPNVIDFGKNIVTALNNFANPTNVGIGSAVFPLITVPMLVLLALGIRKLLSHFHSVRTYVLTMWLAVLVPISILTPENLSSLLVPTMLIMGIGMQTLVEYWYKFFPINPYARVFAILPLSTLIIVMVFGNVNHYYLSVLYSKDASAQYSQDVFLAEKAISEQDTDKLVTLVVEEDKKPLYEAVTKKHTNVTIKNEVEEVQTQITEKKAPVIVSEKKYSDLRNLLAEELPTKLLVNDKKEEGLRFRLFN